LPLCCQARECHIIHRLLSLISETEIYRTQSLVTQLSVETVIHHFVPCNFLIRRVGDTPKNGVCHSVIKEAVLHQTQIPFHSVLRRDSVTPDTVTFPSVVRKDIVTPDIVPFQSALRRESVTTDTVSWLKSGGIIICQTRSLVIPCHFVIIRGRDIPDKVPCHSVVGRTVTGKTRMPQDTGSSHLVMSRDSDVPDTVNCHSVVTKKQCPLSLCYKQK
jgi:hypothetical protein